MMNEVPEAKAKSPKHPPTISTYSMLVKRLKAFGKLVNEQMVYYCANK